MVCLSSRDFVMIGVRVTGLKPFNWLVTGFLDMGMMVVDLRQAGMVACARERLKILVKTSESC